MNIYTKVFASFWFYLFTFVGVHSGFGFKGSGEYGNCGGTHISLEPALVGGCHWTGLDWTANCTHNTNNK